MTKIFWNCQGCKSTFKSVLNNWSTYAKSLIRDVVERVRTGPWRTAPLGKGRGGKGGPRQGEQHQERDRDTAYPASGPKAAHDHYLGPIVTLDRHLNKKTMNAVRRRYLCGRSVLFRGVHGARYSRAVPQPPHANKPQRHTNRESCCGTGTRAFYGVFFLPVDLHFCPGG